MATILDKDLTRESTVTVDERNILVTLTEDQKISFRLKGMKSGMVSISIDELYKQLSGGSSEVSNEEKPKKKVGSDYISLNDLRSANMISDLDYPTKVKFDSIIKSLSD